MSSRILSRREKIVGLSETLRQRFPDTTDIDTVAECDDVVLVRSPGPAGREAGFAHIHVIAEPMYIESLARPGERIRVLGRVTARTVRSVVINPNAGIPEPEIFWHEYYHLFHSPNGVQHSERFSHAYSTEGVLHYQEERRADEFAAAMLVYPMEECENMLHVIERFGVSERLAICAVKLAQQLAAEGRDSHTRSAKEIS